MEKCYEWGVKISEKCYEKCDRGIGWVERIIFVMVLDITKII
jgi:hypothetical protein